MLEIYESDLDSEDKPLPLNHSLSILENSLTQLNKNINNYSTPSKIMEIVHGKVHPGLQQAFNLTLKRWRFQRSQENLWVNVFPYNILQTCNFE